MTSLNPTSRPLPAWLSSFGAPLHVHRTSRGLQVVLVYFAVVGLIAAGGFAIFLVLAPGSGSFHVDKTRIAGPIVASLFVCLVCVVAIAWVFFTADYQHVVFDEALVRTRGTLAEVFRWDEIKAVYEDVLPNEIETARRGMRGYLVEMDDGRRFKIDPRIDDWFTLGEWVVSKAFARLRPLAFEEFDYGGAVAFGRLRVSRDALYSGDARLSWDEPMRAYRQRTGKHSHRHLFEVWCRGDLLPTCLLEVKDIPNVRLFYELVDRACPGCLD